MPDGWIDRLFLRLHAMYGKAWLDLWTGLPISTLKAQWSASLCRCTSEQIRLALAELEQNGTRFPPNLPEFYALCEQFRPRKAPTLYLAAPRHPMPQNAIDVLRKAIEGGSKT